MAELLRVPIAFRVIPKACPRCHGDMTPSDPRVDDGEARCLQCGHIYYGRRRGVGAGRRPDYRTIGTHLVKGRMQPR